MGKHSLMIKIISKNYKSPLHGLLFLREKRTLYYERNLNKGEILMELLWCVIATILSPVKGAQKIMMKILACLDFMDIFGFGVKELGDAAVLKTVEKHKWFGKVVGFCCWTIMTGGIFLYVMVIIWCFKLIIKLFKFIFRKRA